MVKAKKTKDEVPDDASQDDEEEAQSGFWQIVFPDISCKKWDAVSDSNHPCCNIFRYVCFKRPICVSFLFWSKPIPSYHLVIT